MQCNFNRWSAHETCVCVCAKFVLHLLTDDQCQQRQTIAGDLLECSSEDVQFLKNIVTGDETWVYGYDPQKKWQSSQWKGPSSPRPKKGRQVRSILYSSFWPNTAPLNCSSRHTHQNSHHVTFSYSQGLRKFWKDTDLRQRRTSNEIRRRHYLTSQRSSSQNVSNSGKNVGRSV